MRKSNLNLQNQHTILTIDLDDSPDEWYHVLSINPEGNIVIQSNKVDELYWFITNFIQYLNRKGGVETGIIHGDKIGSIKDFITQLNYLFPIGYKVGKYSSHTLYDMLLNFETEPMERYLVYANAEKLLNSDRNAFEDIFEQMVTAAYVNRNGIGTIKEDGTPYQVNQRNIFVFNDLNVEEVQSLLEKEYYIPSINEENQEQVLNFAFLEFL